MPILLQPPLHRHCVCLQEKNKIYSQRLVLLASGEISFYRLLYSPFFFQNFHSKLLLCGCGVCQCPYKSSSVLLYHSLSQSSPRVTFGQSERRSLTGTSSPKDCDGNQNSTQIKLSTFSLKHKRQKIPPQPCEQGSKCDDRGAPCWSGGQQADAAEERQTPW